jgi:hypothetical protein
MRPAQARAQPDEAMRKTAIPMMIRVCQGSKRGRSYRYRYLLDGQRCENDRRADRYGPNPLGSTDSVVVVEWPTLPRKQITMDPAVPRSMARPQYTPARMPFTLLDERATGAP